MMKIMHSIGSFLLGADYELLKLCPQEMQEQKKLVLYALIVSLVTFWASKHFESTELSIAFSIGILLLYITFLSKPGGNFTVKKYTGLIIALLLTYFVYSILIGDIFRISFHQPENLVKGIGTALLMLWLSYAPINYAEVSSNYASLVRRKRNEDLAIAQLAIAEKTNTEKAIIRIKEQARLEAEKENAKYTAEKIKDAHKKAIRNIIEEWQKEISRDLTNNPQAFFNQGNTVTIKPTTASKNELDEYISSLVNDSRKQFVKILVDHWTNLKEKEIRNNPESYIS